jgi:hypothetical protein
MYDTPIAAVYAILSFYIAGKIPATTPLSPALNTLKFYDALNDDRSKTPSQP